MRLRSIVVAAAVAVVPSVAAAQVTAGGEFVVAATPDADISATGHAMALLPSGDFVVVWEHWSTVKHVRAQRFDRAGNRLGTEFTVNTYFTINLHSPKVASLGEDGFVVTWTSLRSGSQGNDVYAQLFETGGQPRGGEFRVNAYSAGEQNVESVAATTGGDFLVVWLSTAQDGSNLGIYARRFARAGVPIGGDFRVNSFTTGNQYIGFAAARDDGSFIVTWTSQVQDGSGQGVYGQWYDPVANTRGVEFRVNDYTTGHQYGASAAFDRAGNAVVAWTSAQDGSGFGVFGRRYDPTGAAIGGEFQVNVATTGNQSVPVVKFDQAGDFVIAYLHGLFNPPPGEVRARRFRADATPIGTEFPVSRTTSGNGPVDPSLIVDAAGNFVVSWDLVGPGGGFNWDVYMQRFGGLAPAALRVDTAGNGVLEPGEASVSVRPSWTNFNGAPQNFIGQIATAQGPPGGVPVIGLLQAVYGTVGDGGTVECTSCYTVSVPAPSPRPATHWDGSVDERILPMTLGQNKRWTLHVGDSFGDVPRANPFYRFVEALLHHGVTGGCTATDYCPSASTTREQMAVFALVAKEGAGYVPPACTTPVFPDVPASSPFCRWIEELFRRGVVGGCGGGSYCPSANVSRDQMAVFVLRTVEPTLSPPACTTPMFADLPASHPFCRWVEELARRGIVSGCGGGNYCPAAPVTREQMGVFIGLTFALTLYGP